MTDAVVDADEAIVRETEEEHQPGAYYLWEFPLTRADKHRRLKHMFEQELAAEQEEADRLRFQLQELQGQLDDKGHDGKSIQPLASSSGVEFPIGPGLMRGSCSCTCRCGAASGIRPGDADGQLPVGPKTIPVTSISLADASPTASSARVATICRLQGIHLSNGFAHRRPAQWQDDAGTETSHSLFSLQLLHCGASYDRRFERAARCRGEDLPPEAWGDGPSGSIGSVRWGETGEGHIDWLRFVPCGGELRAQSDELHVTGEFHLQPGEFVKAIRARATTDGRLADWIDIVTSRLRCNRIGRGTSEVASFGCKAAPGYEICAIQRGAGSGDAESRVGAIAGVEQCRLVNAGGQGPPSPLPDRRSFSPVAPAGCCQLAAQPLRRSAATSGPVTTSRTSCSPARTSRTSTGGGTSLGGLSVHSAIMQKPRSARQSAPGWTSGVEAGGTRSLAMSPAAAIRAIAAADSGSASRRRLSSGGST